MPLQITKINPIIKNLDLVLLQQMRQRLTSDSGKNSVANIFC